MKILTTAYAINAVLPSKSIAMGQVSQKSHWNKDSQGDQFFLKSSQSLCFGQDEEGIEPLNIQQYDLVAAALEEAGELAAMTDPIREGMTLNEIMDHVNAQEGVIRDFATDILAAREHPPDLVDRYFQMRERGIEPEGPPD